MMPKDAQRDQVEEHSQNQCNQLACPIPSALTVVTASHAVTTDSGHCPVGGHQDHGPKLRLEDKEEKARTTHQGDTSSVRVALGLAAGSGSQEGT